MAKDPAFLFYPGDYLRDTQCLSEKSQVAYDRIMCEHMRNICITYEQLNFFTKRLSDEEKKEVLMLLKKTKAGYQIEWVAESICKRMDYSESRSKNRKGKSKNISSSYDNHMEIEIEIENEDVNKKENEDKREKIKRISMPFGEKFNETWKEWKLYKLKQHEFKYKSDGTEQAALHSLTSLANDEKTCIEIIHQSMANGWKGFFNLKTNGNGNTTNKQTIREQVQHEINKRYGNGQ